MSRRALPSDERLLRAARCIEEALATEEVSPVRKAYVAFLASAAEFYGVAVPAVRVLRARPIRVREGGGRRNHYAHLSGWDSEVWQGGFERKGCVPRRVFHLGAGAPARSFL